MSTTSKTDQPIFKDYILKRRIGEGGYGRVYLVRNDVGKEFALKVLFKDVVKEKRGVESVIKIRSNRLVNILDYGETTDGEFCVLMEYMPRGFAAIAAAGKLREEIARHYFREILAGLKVLEHNRIIHRDIKPGNLFIREQDRIVKIGDFGTARFTTGNTSTRTKVVGTITYCAPECFKNNALFSADRWAACVIFYRMLTGRFPFYGDDYPAIFGAIMAGEPDYADVPENYIDFFQRCFEKQAMNRFEDAGEMIRAFDDTGSPDRILAELQARINVLETERDEARRQLDQLTSKLADKPHVHGDYIRINGRDVAFAKDRAEARIATLEDEIKDLRQQIDNATQPGESAASDDVVESQEIQKLRSAVKETPSEIPQPARPEPPRQAPAEQQSTIIPLRSESRTLSDMDVKAMVKAHGFYEKDWNSSGRFKNDLTDNDDGTLTDHATGLIWQQSGTDSTMNFKEAGKYAEKMNKDKFAGFCDWRLPTLEELVSLMEPVEHNDLFIDPLFDSNQWRCRSSDQLSSGGGCWYVSFLLGEVNSIYDGGHVRLVRHGQ